MAQQLSDGSIVPSFRRPVTQGLVSDPGVLSDFQLHLGEVKFVHDPDSNQPFRTYRVEVMQRAPDGAFVSTMYDGCILSNPLGGAADQLAYSLRADSKKGVGTGSKVLLLCVNGSKSGAVILGGIRDNIADSNDKDTDTDEGAFFKFRFNGVTAAINDDGELRIDVKGATKADGSPDSERGADTSKVTTSIGVLKNGDFYVQTKDGAQSIYVDHENKELRVQADKKWTLSINGDLLEEVGGDSTSKVKGLLRTQTDGRVEHSSKQDYNVASAGNINLDSKGVLIGRATDSFMLGTTYRRAQQALHQALQAGLTSLFAQLTQVASAASGPLAIPMIGGTIAGPIIGPAMVQASITVSQMMQALATFEAQGPSYLSSSNLTD